MKAFTLRQPYADLVADGLKTVETRHYSFMNRPGHPQFGERFAIHAAKRKPTRADWAAVGYPYSPMSNHSSNRSP